MSIRTTVTLGDDVHAEMERLRRDEDLRPSEALDLLARQGMTQPRPHRVDITGNLVPYAQIAAQAIELGVAVASVDSDFARFPEIRWVNPLHP